MTTVAQPETIRVTRARMLARRLNDRYEHIVPFRVPGTVIHVHTNDTMTDPPAPAWYDPKTHDISIHVDRAGVADLIDGKATSTERAIFEGDPYTSSPLEAKVCGLLVHEAAHSVRSVWLDKYLGRKHDFMQIIQLFEEIRIERWAVDTKIPFIRRVLRASFDIILGRAEMPAVLDRWSAAFNWALLYGRVFAGVADETELESLDTAARTLLGDDDLDRLIDILQEVTIVSNSDPDRIVELAQEWVDVVGLPATVTIYVDCSGESTGPPIPVPVEDSKPGEPGKGTSGDEDADEKTSPTDPSKGKADSDEKSEETDDDKTDKDGNPAFGKIGSVEDTDTGDFDDDDDGSFSAEDGKLLEDALDSVLEEIIEAFDERGKNQLRNADEYAKRVFGGKQDRKSSRNWDVIKPSPDVRREVTRVARALETLAIPAITKTSAAGELPPGRLRSREALTVSADRAAGRMTEARPWKTTKRRHSEVKPVIVGVMTDTSGSMGWAELAVAEYAYVLSNAGSRVGARTAAVTFGNSAEAVSWPGTPAATVNARRADGGHEAFDDAIAALDGVLKLTTQNNASKLLLIVSDGHLVRSGEPLKAKLWLEKLDKAGVKVIWLTNTNESGIRAMAPKAQVATVRDVWGHRGSGKSDLSKTMLDVTIRALEAM